MDTVKIKIASEYFFNNADLLLPAIKDASGNLLKDGITTWLTQSYELTPKDHTEDGVTRSGYNAAELNSVLREKMTVISGIHKETHVEYGAILTTGKKGFDFSLFDEEYNTIKIRNSFVGNPGRYNGETPLLALNKKVLKADGSTFSRKRDWKDKLDSLGGVPGENIECQKQRYTIVGEIQFGNWAIVRHDLLRLLNSSSDGEIDYYVYITATGDLERKLSSGIVSFTDVVSLFRENKQLVRTPVWVIGIDIDVT